MTVAGRFGNGAGRPLPDRGKRERVPPRRFSVGAKIAAPPARGSLPAISPSLHDEVAAACLDKAKALLRRCGLAEGVSDASRSEQ
jgi:hypothetical protein